VNEVFVKLWKGRDRVPGIHNLRVYLYTATKNASLNYLSRKANQLVTEPFDHISIQLREEQCPDQQLITAEIFNKIRMAIEELPPRCKMIFKLVREDGLKYKEVAEVLNVAVKTVDAQMVIAVKKISEKVKSEFEFFPGLATKKSIGNKQ
jgi:RNA polymerase sigma-70 factor (ECF subfamily)